MPLVSNSVLLFTLTYFFYFVYFVYFDVFSALTLSAASRDSEVMGDVVLSAREHQTVE